jgi:hypothetical protein
MPLAEAASVFEDLSLGRASRGRFLLGGCGALRLHLAAVEANGPSRPQVGHARQATLYVVGNVRALHL